MAACSPPSPFAGPEETSWDRTTMTSRDPYMFNIEYTVVALSYLIPLM